MKTREPRRLIWDSGTAYDFFQSLLVLHQPGRFGVRGAWTAGMRARLTPAARRTLEQAQRVIRPPVHWIYTLPPPKDVETALWSLSQIPAEKRLATLALRYDAPPADVAEMLQRVAAQGKWGKDDLALLRAHLEARHPNRKRSLSEEACSEILAVWARAGEFGEEYLTALRNYHAAFFREEEQRISSALEAALARAQALAEQLPLPDLLEELSQGVRIDEPLLGEEVVLVPSYWITPLVMLVSISSTCRLCLFGARPATDSLVPGETVPEALLRALKALSDPTRLKILRYLARAPLTPTELARELRLRTPTVMHHLHALRLAGLVQVMIGTGEERKRYALRPNAPAEVGRMLAVYLEEDR